MCKDELPAEAKMCSGSDARSQRNRDDQERFLSKKLSVLLAISRKILFTPQTVEEYLQLKQRDDKVAALKGHAEEGDRKVAEARIEKPEKDTPNVDDKKEKP